MAVAVFDYAQFTALFPELTGGGVTESVADIFFGVAELLLDNTECSLIADVAQRLTLLNYATAHMASLSGYPLQAGATEPVSSGLVGRVASATEGTVSVTTDYGKVSETAAWWLQSQYGALFWQLTRALRTARYVAAPPRYFGPGRGFGRWPS